MFARDWPLARTHGHIELTARNEGTKDRIARVFPRHDGYYGERWLVQVMMANGFGKVAAEQPAGLDNVYFGSLEAAKEARASVSYTECSWFNSSRPLRRSNGVPTRAGKTQRRAPASKGVGAPFVKGLR